MVCTLVIFEREPLQPAIDVVRPWKILKITILLSLASAKARYCPKILVSYANQPDQP